ncbi:energy transducer TonB [Shewanella japonica]|uniref:energy transducer TonB n=1 Tax=Shewanella japonica TaxID=93973 RepID=UPI000E73DDF2|nr:TonB family protein [Shewanella japonica]
MKKLVKLAILFLAVISVSTIAVTSIYADVQVTNVKPTSDFAWQRENKNTPKYPIELARSGIRGCAVLSFNITESGETEDVEIISSIPNKQLGKFSRKMIKKWNWTAATGTEETIAEKRIVRLDFCFDDESTEHTQKMCKQQTQFACASNA